MVDMDLYTIRPLGYERVYLPLYKVADTPFHIHMNCTQFSPTRLSHLFAMSNEHSFTLWALSSQYKYIFINSWKMIKMMV